MQPSRSVRLLVGILALASISLVSACSGGSAAAPAGPTATVASVSHGTASTVAPTTAAAADDRPLVRIDTDPKEIDRMYEAYGTCLTDHGMPPEVQKKFSNKSPEYADALNSCAAKEPENYQDREKRQNPELFQDHQRKQIKCMRDHGLAIETDADGWGYTNPGRDMGSAWDTKCERLAFGG